MVQTGREEQRKWPRYATLQVPAHFAYSDSVEVFGEGILVNISKGGAYIHGPALGPAPGILTIYLPSVNKMKITKKCKVVSAPMKLDLGFAVEFQTELADAELAHVIDEERSANSGGDREVSPNDTPERSLAEKDAETLDREIDGAHTHSSRFFVGIMAAVVTVIVGGTFSGSAEILWETVSLCSLIILMILIIGFILEASTLAEINKIRALRARLNCYLKRGIGPPSYEGSTQLNTNLNLCLVGIKSNKCPLRDTSCPQLGRNDTANVPLRKRLRFIATTSWPLMGIYIIFILLIGTLDVFILSLWTVLEPDLLYGFDIMTGLFVGALLISLLVFLLRRFIIILGGELSFLNYYNTWRYVLLHCDTTF